MKPLFFSLIILLLAAGCRKEDGYNTVYQNGSDVFPNKTGDTWVYLVEDTVFSFSNTGVVSRYNMTVTVTDSVQLPGGIKANRWVYDYPGGPDTNYVYQHGDTVSFITNIPPYTYVDRQYIIPMQLNNSWQYVINSLNKVSVDSSATITVGQNHFENAYDIRGIPGWPDAFFTIDEWVADYIGVVKRYYRNDGYTIGPVRHRTSWSLISYDLK